MRRPTLRTKRRNRYYVRFHDGTWKVYRWSTVQSTRGPLVDRYKLVAVYPPCDHLRALRKAQQLEDLDRRYGRLF